MSRSGTKTTATLTRSIAMVGQVARRDATIAVVDRAAVARHPVSGFDLDHAGGLLLESARTPRLGHGVGFCLFRPLGLFGVRERRQRERERNRERNGQGLHRKLPSVARAAPYHSRRQLRFTKSRACSRSLP